MLRQKGVTLKQQSHLRGGGHFHVMDGTRVVHFHVLYSCQREDGGSNPGVWLVDRFYIDTYMYMNLCVGGVAR